MSLDKQSLFYFLITASIFTYVRSNDCPSMKHFQNSTGILFVEKNLLKTNESFFHCQWSITSNSDQKILLEFDFVYVPIPIEEYLKGGCRRSSVSLWAPDIDDEKLFICGNRKNIRLNGEGQKIFLELFIDDFRIDFRFQFRYRFVQIERAIATPSYLSDFSFFSSENFQECGRPFVKNSFRSKIVGGQQVDPHSFPWQVLLTDRTKFCGATILNENWIVTAAHCVNGTFRQNLLAEFGVHDRFSIENSRKTRKIEKIIVHPMYGGKSARWIHDIALLRLSEPLSFNVFIRSICLASESISVKIGDQTIVTGWGDTRGTGQFRYLRKVQITIQPNEICKLTQTQDQTSLCAGLCQNQTCDACQGDSGGPMVLFHEDRWYLVGLISWGFSCAGLGVYTKVSFYLDWIEHWISQ